MTSAFSDIAAGIGGVWNCPSRMFTGLADVSATLRAVRLVPPGTCVSFRRIALPVTPQEASYAGLPEAADPDEGK
jgi:hypothetical protein